MACWCMTKLRRFDLVDGSADGAADPAGTPPRLS
jgi:hypothetical protein